MYSGRHVSHAFSLLCRAIGQSAPHRHVASHDCCSRSASPTRNERDVTFLQSVDPAASDVLHGNSSSYSVKSLTEPGDSRPACEQQRIDGVYKGGLGRGLSWLPYPEINPPPPKVTNLSRLSALRCIVVSYDGTNYTNFTVWKKFRNLHLLSSPIPLLHHTALLLSKFLLARKWSHSFFHVPFVTGNPPSLDYFQPPVSSIPDALSNVNHRSQ